MNAATVGAASELIASGHLMRLGYHVYRALSSSAPVDLVAWREGEALQRVEVKSGSFTAPRTHTFFKPTSDNWDLLVVVDREANVFIYPRSQYTADEAMDSYRRSKSGRAAWKAAS